MNQNAFAARGILAAPFGCLRIANIYVAVYEVVNHLNVVLDFEFAHGGFAQIFRDSGNAVALLNGITGNWQV